MSERLRTAPISLPDWDISEIATEARAQGFRFLERLMADWDNGANRFDQSGEVFLGLFEGERLVGFGGINRDPYTTDRVGRLRHVYVLGRRRGGGLGRILVEALLDHAEQQFRAVRLRTADADAAAFYEMLDFEPIEGADATHIHRFESWMTRAAIAVMVKDGKVLLGKRTAYKPAYAYCWDYIGGRVESGETPEQTLAREMGEELAIRPTQVRFLERHLDRTVDPDDPPVYYFYIVTGWEGGAPRVANDEHSEIRWFDLDEMSALPDLADRAYLAMAERALHLG